MSEKDPPGTGAEESSRQTPIVEEDFAALLKKFKVKSPLAENIAENISKTGGESVFENPKLLADRLTSWSGEIAPTNRKLILEQWCAEKGIEVPQDLLHKAGLSDKERKALEKEEEADKSIRYVYDAELRVVRMAKSGEIGGTLAEAQRLKEMAEGTGGESPFIPGEDGKLQLNPKAKISGIELLAWESIKKAQDTGAPVDPLTALADAAEKMKIYKEALGGGSNVPSWMSDPVEFITRVRAITGDSGVTEEIKQQLAGARQEIKEMKDAQLRGTIEAQQKQIEVLTGKLGQVLDRVDDLQRGNVGRTEMDILHEIATGGLSFFKQELPAFRGDIRSIVTGVGLPPIKSPGERAARKEQFTKGLQADQEIADLGQRLFLEQS